MFVVFLRFSTNKAKAPDLMGAHNLWIERGFAEGIFLLTGSLKPSAGGFILAKGETLAQLEERLAEDPFVAQGVVTTEIHEIAPGRTAPHLALLMS